MKTHSLAFLLFIAACFMPQNGHALKLQLLHTNDLHSFFEGPRAAKGGYSRLKTLIEDLKKKGKQQGAVTLFLDGGDFGEGSSYFMADQGATSLRMLDELGVQYTVLGNHDFMFGGKILSEQIKRAKLKTKVLSANLKQNKWEGLKNDLKSMDVIEIQGVKIAIFGLTTSDSHYQYFIRDTGSINNPLDNIDELEKKAKKLGADYTIALTHIGLELDRKLAKKSKSIDFIVGGHSHTLLPVPELTRNKNGKQVPIVQAGAYSVAIGEAYIDIDPSTKTSKFVSYKMHHLSEEIPKDPAIDSIIQKAKISRDNLLGRDYDDVVGYTEVNIGGYVDKDLSQPSCWSKKIAQLTRDAAKTDIGIHSEVLEGEGIPTGPIRFGDIIENYPHFNKFGDKGWQVSTIRLNGFVLTQLLHYLYLDTDNLRYFVSGVEVTVKNKIPFFRINGKKISWFNYYSIAVPDQLVQIFIHNYPLFKGIVYKKMRKTDIHYWEMIENYVKENTPISCEK